MTARQVCDFELLATGGFAPLSGFQTRQDYDRVLSDLRLADGTLWPIPVTLDVTEEFARSVEERWRQERQEGQERQKRQERQRIALRDSGGRTLGLITVEDVWQPDRVAEAAAVFGCTTREHPGVADLLDRAGTWCVGGPVEALEPPSHHDFPALRRTPAELRAEFARRGWTRIVAFQTRNPIHRAHFEMTVRAAREARAGLLVHPVVGMTMPGDVDHYTRVRCYQAVMPEYPPGLALLSLLPLAMRMAGPREALWHAIIRKNYGCTHFIVGRDHAGPGPDSKGTPFYQPYAAQELVRQYQAEIGITMIPFREMVYLPDRDAYVPEDEVPPNAQVAKISGTELRRRLENGGEIPSWFTFPAVEQALRAGVRPKNRRGLVVWFTGLPASGKSTIAKIVEARLLESGERTVSLLDGDVIRQHLSSGLGFSRADRDTHIRRIGYVASEIARHGGVALCAAIAPYDDVRREVRKLAAERGAFVLVYVSTPVEVCAERDPKGLYARARAGEVKQFTGVSDPYQSPSDAELVLDTTKKSAEECAEEVLGYLEEARYLDAR